jgi:RNA polymerase sigma-70 factor, ECF subfamily
MTDGALVGRALEGDTAAYGELVGRWSARILAFCQFQCGSRHTAEDLAQETLLRGFRGLRSLDQPERFGPWLRGIAQNVFLDWRKARQTSQVPLSVLGGQTPIDGLLTTDTDAAVRAVDHDDELRELRRAVDSLDEDLRTTLMLYYTHDVTYAELAAMLDVSAATVNARLTRARELLRNRLKQVES